MAMPDSHDSCGLFDGFEHFRTALDSDYIHGLQSGMVVPDANVLLNLYRYTPQARDDIFRILEKLGDRLWIPHQVADEFWRNRQNAQQDAVKAFSAVVDTLSKNLNSTSNAINSWANRTSVSKDVMEPIIATIKNGYDEAFVEVRKHADEAARSSDWRTDKDPVLARLVAILDGRVGVAPSDEQLAEWRTEAERRIETKAPPGFMDRNKKGQRAYGDYIIWAEVLIEAARRRKTVVLVTGDIKPDWWNTDEHGRPRGPRVELAAELRTAAGVQLLAMRPEILLQTANAALAIQVKEESLRSVKRIDLATALKTQMPHAPDAILRWQTLADMMLNYSEFLKSKGFTVGTTVGSSGDISLTVATADRYFMIKGYMPSPGDRSDQLIDAAVDAARSIDEEQNSFFPIESVILTVSGDSEFAPVDDDDDYSVVEDFEDGNLLIVWPLGSGWYGSTAATSAGLTSTYEDAEDESDDLIDDTDLLRRERVTIDRRRN